MHHYMSPCFYFHGLCILNVTASQSDFNHNAKCVSFLISSPMVFCVTKTKLKSSWSSKILSTRITFLISTSTSISLSSQHPVFQSLCQSFGKSYLSVVVIPFSIIYHLQISTANVCFQILAHLAWTTVHLRFISWSVIFCFSIEIYTLVTRMIIPN